MSASSLLESPIIWGFGVFILSIIIYLFYSYLKTEVIAMFFDAFEGALSYADNFVMGLGLTGIDVGDWIAAVCIFLYYRKKVGDKLAVLFALEAANFGLSLIPVIGESAEIFFGFFPLITIVMTYKMYKANQEYAPVEEYYLYLQDEGIAESNAIADELKADVDDVKQLYHNCNFDELAKQAGRVEKALHAEVKEIILKKLNTAQNIIIEKLEKEVQQKTGTISENELMMLKNAIQQTMNDIDEDWKTADNRANSILQSVSSFGYSAKASDDKEEDVIEESKEAA